MRTLLKILGLVMCFFTKPCFATMPVIDIGAITQLGIQVGYLRQQLDALKQLTPGQYQWSNAQNLINQLGDAVQRANTLAYSAQNVDAQFRQYFPGYQAPTDYGQQYQHITRTQLDTLNQILQAMGSSAQDFQNENARLTFLQHQAQSAVGQTQAIQAAAQIASEQVSQTQLLRQTMIAQTNAQTAYYAGQVQKEASSRAELEKIAANGKQAAPAIGDSGHYLKLPDFH